MKYLGSILAAAIFAGLAVSAFAADPPAQPASPPQLTCNFPDTAEVTLSVKKGEVDAVLVLLQNGSDAMTIGQYKALNAAIGTQVQALRAKFCK